MKYPASFGLRRLAAVLLTAAMALGCAACGTQAGSQVAGADQQVIYGYVLEVNDQARTIMIDPVELVAATDTRRLDQLGVGTDLQSAGGESYAYNARPNFVMYALDTTASFDFNDNGGSSSGLMGGNGSLADRNGSDPTGGDGSLLSGNGTSGGNGNGNDAGLMGGNGTSGGNGNGNGNGGGLLGGNGSSSDSGSGSDNGSLASAGNGSGSGSGSSSDSGSGSGNGGGLLGGNGNGSGSGNRSGGNGNSANNTNASQAGNSVSGNTTVGNGTVSDDDNVSGNGGNGSGSGNGKAMGDGYGYTGVRGGLFSAFGNDFDRLNAYIDQYDNLLCRLVLENGAVTAVTVCTRDNM